MILNKNSVSFLFTLDLIRYQQFIIIVVQTSSYDKIVSINVITEHDDWGERGCLPDQEVRLFLNAYIQISLWIKNLLTNRDRQTDT